MQGLLRVCQRLLPYKEDTADALLRSLKLVRGLSPDVAWDLAERIAAEVGSRCHLLSGIVVPSVLPLVLPMSPEVTWDLAERIAAEVGSRCHPQAVVVLPHVLPLCSTSPGSSRSVSQQW